MILFGTPAFLLSLAALRRNLGWIAWWLLCTAAVGAGSISVYMLSLSSAGAGSAPQAGINLGIFILMLALVQYALVLGLILIGLLIDVIVWWRHSQPADRARCFAALIRWPFRWRVLSVVAVVVGLVCGLYVVGNTYIAMDGWIYVLGQHFAQVNGTESETQLQRWKLALFTTLAISSSGALLIIGAAICHLLGLNNKTK